MAGFPQNNQSPRVDIEFFGVWGRQDPPVFFSAAVDTGFTGGVSIPTTQALPLGLTLYSTANFTLADGSIESTLICLGWARLGEVDKPMAFSLTNTGSEILVGTELLAVFQARLELDYKTKTFSLIPQVLPHTKT